ncbi:sensor histidine kinase [Nitrosomonas supralitoralis]|uniref:histidine kinase n=1 Tax=Nitrosomonas supralitoralis TaxID=2116706 RepID=A0A2P7NSR4_9PROT|nr:PAS domain S-box protein [Nitrosomonas supralitoralis]PSJ16514.1 hypothetical protein C7H79_13045 [Nitrosomonas supralitoralis]
MDTVSNELQSLRRAIRDVVAVSTFPAIWLQNTPNQIADSLAEMLYSTLRLEFTFVSICNCGRDFIRKAYTRQGFLKSNDVDAIYQNLAPLFSAEWRSNIIKGFTHPLSGEGSVQLIIIAIGTVSKHNVLVAGSTRKDFPTETERLVLNVAVNQAAVTIEQKLAQERAEHAERAIRESEARYVLASRATRDAIWDWNLVTNQILWNEAMHTEYGYSLEVMNGDATWWYEHIHPEDREHVVEAIHQIIESGEQNWHHEYRYQRADGTYATVFDRGYVVHLNGKPVRMLGAMQDVSIRKEAEEKIKALHQQAEAVRQELRDFIEQSPAAMYMVKGPQHEFTLANSHYLKLVERGMDKLIGKTIREVFSESEDGWFLSLANRVYQTGVPFVGKEMPFRNPAGKECFLNVVYQAFRASDGKILGLLGFAHDVTEEVLARKKAEELATDLQVAVQARDDFLSIASHELKTPITSLKLQIQMISRSLMKSSVRNIPKGRLEKMLISSNRQIEMLVNLVDDLLDVSRIINGKLLMKPSLMNLADMVNEVVERFQDQLDSSKISLTINADKDVIGVWDWHRLEQVFTNLLTNAIKYGNGKPIQVQVKNLETSVSLSIIDHGIGISKENQGIIFNRFERINAVDTYSGLGLGLLIAKEIVTTHGGKILVESELEKGSTFTVELPIKAPGSVDEIVIPSLSLRSMS